MAKAKKNNTPELWERQETESAKAFEAFCIYRGMGTLRSVRKVAQSLNKSVTLIAGWSTKHEWVKRVKAWDVDQDQIAREAQKKAIKEMNDRQARLAYGIQVKMLQVLGQMDITKVKPLEMARLLEVSMKHERIARGADAMSQQVDETKSGGGSEKDEAAKAWIKALIGSDPEGGDPDDE